MTTRSPFTEQALRKLIRAFHKEGYRIAGAKPDGTMIVYSGDERPEGLSIVPGHEEAKEADTWADR